MRSKNKKKQTAPKNGKQNKLLLSIRLEASGDFSSPWFKAVIIAVLIIIIMFVSVALFKVVVSDNNGPAKPSIAISV